MAGSPHGWPHAPRRGELTPSGRPTFRLCWLPCLWAGATTLIVTLALQSLLLARALGNADYSTGRAGGLGVGTALVLAAATAGGALVGRHRLRPVGLAARSRSLLITLGPALAALVVAGSGVLSGARATPVLAVPLGAVVGLAAVVGWDRRHPSVDPLLED